MASESPPHVDVGVYLLGKLHGEEAEQFQAHRAGCAQCQQELAELESLPTLLAQAAPPHPPPPVLRERTLAAVREAAGQPARPATAAVIPLRPRRWPVITAAAAAVVVLVVSGALVLGSLARRPVTELTLVAAEGGTGSGRVVFTDAGVGRAFEAEIEGLPPPPPGSYYELWAVGPEDSPEEPDRVSLATFTIGNEGPVVLTGVTAASAARYTRVGVTLEPDDGNPARTGNLALAPGPEQR